MSEDTTYYERNKEKCKAWSKAYQDAHKDMYKNYQKEYYQKNKERARERARKNTKNRQVVFYKKERPPPKVKKVKKEKIVKPVRPQLTDLKIDLPKIEEFEFNSFTFIRHGTFEVTFE